MHHAFAGNVGCTDMVCENSQRNVPAVDSIRETNDTAYLPIRKLSPFGVSISQECSICTHSYSMALCSVDSLD